MVVVLSVDETSGSSSSSSSRVDGSDSGRSVVRKGDIGRSSIRAEWNVGNWHVREIDYALEGRRGLRDIG